LGAVLYRMMLLKERRSYPAGFSGIRTGASLRHPIGMIRNSISLGDIAAYLVALVCGLVVLTVLALLPLLPLLWLDVWLER
jgi:hypothetical protein